MAYYAYVSLENIDRELVSRDLESENGDVLKLADYPVGAEVELEDWPRDQECIFKRTEAGWRQIYAATPPLIGTLPDSRAMASA